MMKCLYTGNSARNVLVAILHAAVTGEGFSFAVQHQNLSLLQCAALLAPGAEGAILHFLHFFALATVPENSFALQKTSRQHGSGLHQNIPRQTIVFFCSSTHQACGELRFRVAALVCGVSCKTVVVSKLSGAPANLVDN